ncbi:gastrula zinc finger protein XlCGF46.1 [Scaptodrosophila lebanonensis]|uniref:Gastrula zinc finger protein XlCGF46.1 n=1 Tax=Drosophila lebanonensis TaxID=7225 RepID=A0A6J2TTF0_DROLE|nr:gastrula zinc finger protein XlCGF46.1 [Scaptodrosophila lebanonensis]
MLKALKPDTYAGIANAKCGEVYFQDLTSYRIDCVFCEMKSFVFGDFLLHIQNVHFENGLLKTEVVQPKQEQRGSQSPPVSVVARVNPLAWYDVEDNGIESGEIAGDAESDSDDNDDYDYGAEIDGRQDDGDMAGIQSSAIMKWDNARAVATASSGPTTQAASGRSTRSLNVCYNEDSENDVAAHGDYDADSDSKGPAARKKQKLACPDCGKVYQSKKTLRRHMMVQHKSVDSEAGNTEDDADYKPPKVSVPKLSMEYKCEHCEKIYHGKYTLKQHVKRDHDISMNETFTCTECNVKLPRQRLLDEHVVEAHGGAPCLVCGRRYRTRHELKRHQLKHSSERNVPCTHPGCGKRFFSTRHMRNHSKVHSEEKNFVCESCGYSCRNKETLRVHIRSHTGERPFACKVCSKSFPSHSGLREHMAMHSTERPHICNVCGATFSRQKGLYHHKFLHSATKQFVCKLCGNAYAQAAGLAGHMRKHRNDELNG